MYEQEIKGKASTEAAAAEAVHARENGENFSQVGTSVICKMYALLKQHFTEDVIMCSYVSSIYSVL